MIGSLLILITQHAEGNEMENDWENDLEFLKEKGLLLFAIAPWETHLIAISETDEQAE